MIRFKFNNEESKKDEFYFIKVREKKFINRKSKNEIEK